MISGIKENVAVAQDVSSCRKEHMIVVAEVQDCTDIKAHFVSRTCGREKNAKCLRSYRKDFRKVMLRFPSCEPRVGRIPRDIHQVTAASIRGPRSPALLHPKREKNLHIARAQSLRGISRGEFNQGKHAYLGHKRRLVDKAIFQSELNIPRPIGESARPGTIEGERDNQMNLRLLENAKVYFNMRSCSGNAILIAHYLRSAIKLPMMVVYRLRVIRAEGRARQDGSIREKANQKSEAEIPCGAPM